MISKFDRLFRIFSALAIVKVSCDFPTDFSSCRLDCWAQPGLASCVTDDFRGSHCCDNNNAECMKRYNYCSLGLNNEAWKYFTCPAFDCPRNNEPLVIYHDEFNKERFDEIKWGWDPQKIGFNCRVRIHADPKLNGKLNVKLFDTADQNIHVMWQPLSFGDKYNEQGGPWGLFETGHINYNAWVNLHDQVPTDWQFYLYYYVMYLNMFSSKRILIKTWVEHLEERDIEKINGIWKPTAAEYITPEERKRREEAEKLKYQELLEDKLARLEKELEEERSNKIKEIEKLKTEIDLLGVEYDGLIKK